MNFLAVALTSTRRNVLKFELRKRMKYKLRVIEFDMEVTRQTDQD